MQEKKSQDYFTLTPPMTLMKKRIKVSEFKNDVAKRFRKKTGKRWTKNVNYAYSAIIKSFEVIAFLGYVVPFFNFGILYPVFNFKKDKIGLYVFTDNIERGDHILPPLFSLHIAQKIIQEKIKNLFYENTTNSKFKGNWRRRFIELTKKNRNRKSS